MQIAPLIVREGILSALSLSTTFTFYGKYAFRTEGASVTCCVKSLQLLKKKKKLDPLLNHLKKNYIELKKY